MAGHIIILVSKSVQSENHRNKGKHASKQETKKQFMIVLKGERIHIYSHMKT